MSLYLKEFNFPTIEKESTWIHNNLHHKCFNTFYPFHVISQRGLEKLEFEPITILYGGNGSGKTTVLNIIAEKLGLARDSGFNKSSFFYNYLDLCEYDSREVPKESSIITSDDVFDYMLNLRAMNDGIDNHRDKLFSEYLKIKTNDVKLNHSIKSAEDLDRLKLLVDVRKNTQSMFIKKKLGMNVPEKSNGESAIHYFTNYIKENALYLLDEPENSLSPAKQLELVKFLEESARFYGCQFLIATHSPFLLAMKHAKIYDLDTYPVCTKAWTELENVRLYYEFFKGHEGEF